jgi:hypothetical protein
VRGTGYDANRVKEPRVAHRDINSHPLYFYFYFPTRRARAGASPSDLRQINSAILKFPDAAWNS